MERDSGHRQTMMEATWRGQLKGKNFRHWKKKQIHFNAAPSIVMSPKTLVAVELDVYLPRSRWRWLGPVPR